MKISSVITYNLIAIIFLANLFGCSNNSVKPKVVSNIPTIRSVVDLGSILPDKNNLADNVKHNKMSDKRFSPGEFIFIKGENLANTKVQLDGLALPVEWKDQTGVLMRLPRSMHPFEQHQLTFSSAFGEVNYSFYSSHYIVGTDTDGNRIHFLRSNPREKGEFDEDTLEYEQDRPLFNLIEPSGGFLFSIGVKSKTDRVDGQDYGLELQTIHLNNPRSPKKYKTQLFTLKSTPISVSINEQSQIIILGKQHLMLIDASDIDQLKEIDQIDLPMNPDELKTTFVDAVFIDSSKKLAVLEAYSNQVYLYSLEQDSTPKLLSQISLLTSGDQPLSVDLTVDPDNSNNLWVTLGSNLRLLGRKIANIGDKTNSNKKHAVEKLIALNVHDNQLERNGELALPKNFIPFFSIIDQNANLLVSGIHSQFFEMEEDLDWTDQIKQVLPMLLKTAQTGSILQINPNTGEIKNLVEGVGIYYHIATIPKKGPVFTLLKLTGSIWFPYIKVAWGIGVNGRGTYSLRDLENSAIFPPYSLGYISVQ